MLARLRPGVMQPERALDCFKHNLEDASQIGCLLATKIHTRVRQHRKLLALRDGQEVGQPENRQSYTVALIRPCGCVPQTPWTGCAANLGLRNEPA
eukprot:354069-Chlamydomonas_euryale.AAC.16